MVGYWNTEYGEQRSIITSMEGYKNYKWFEITDEAKNQMEKLLSKNPDKYAVSLIVEGGGCAGFRYDWSFDDIIQDTDEYIIFDGFTLLLDNASILYLTGMTIEYKKEIFGSFLELKNPNATSSCGCGESFGV